MWVPLPCGNLETACIHMYRIENSYNQSFMIQIQVGTKVCMKQQTLSIRLTIVHDKIQKLKLKMMRKSYIPLSQHANSVFTLPLSLLLGLELFLVHLAGYSLYSLLAFSDAVAKEKNAEIGLLSVVAVWTQLMAYGIGFITEAFSNPPKTNPQSEG